MKMILAIALAGVLGALLVAGSDRNGPADLLGEQRLTIDRQMVLIANQRQTIKLLEYSLWNSTGVVIRLADEVKECKATRGWEL
jgi:hypothetical protein